MDTAAINQRVADFLKKYPPFHVIEELDLVRFAGRGRVKFFEPHQYVLSQGASRLQVLVIQQGTVLLWDERGAESKLLDVRGAGDMLGIDQFDDARGYPYSARSASDVLVYAFPADEFGTLVQKYPQAKQHVSAYGKVTADYRLPLEGHAPHNVLLRDLVRGRDVRTCDAQSSILEAARSLLTTGYEAVAVLDSEQRVRAVLTADSFLEWIVKGGGNAHQSLATLVDRSPLTIAANASIADAVLAMAGPHSTALAITSDGTANGRLDAILTSQDLGQVFGDRPVDILRDIRRAVDTRALRHLNERARAFVLRYLTNAASTDWLAGFISTVDRAIVERIITIAALEEVPACWCFSGSSGREESVTCVAPHIVMIADDSQDQSRSHSAYQRVLELLDQCGYLPNSGAPFESSFNAASASEWKKRYSDWVSDPILKEIYRARPFFDLRAVLGRENLWQDIEAATTHAFNREFLYVVANDCLATLPPLTFFENAVVDETGAETTVFRLEDTALRPLVDVGRVFGMAARRIFGTSTIERFDVARKLLPGNASIFTEAAESLRIVLWQQGRTGISQGTAGSELPPSQLSRYDRQILRSGFRSILQLLEFTGDLKWLQSL